MGVEVGVVAAAASVGVASIGTEVDSGSETCSTGSSVGLNSASEGVGDGNTFTPTGHEFDRTGVCVLRASSAAGGVARLARKCSIAPEAVGVGVGSNKRDVLVDGLCWPDN